MTRLSVRRVDTPIGTLTLIASDAGLRRVLFAGRAPADEGFAPDDLVVDEAHPVLEATAGQLGEYFAGERRRFDVPLDLVGTDFQVAAWRALAEIPYGTTITYGRQAEAIGRPGAFRAVGAANGANPVPVVLPCHRVVGADGSLTGFGGGLATKARLLALESEQASLPGI